MRGGGLRTTEPRTGSLPSGGEIARQYGRHEQWGRLVKRAGLAGELSGHNPLPSRSKHREPAVEMQLSASKRSAGPRETSVPKRRPGKYLVVFPIKEQL